MAKVKIHTPNAPQPPAQFSQAVRKGNILALAGQVGVSPDTGKPVSSDVAEQTRQALINLGSVLKEAGSSFEDVIMIRVYLTDASYFPAMNQVYSEFVSEPFPSRTTIYAGLPVGLLVEIDALAVLG
jgi:2-iminobutanoate/2-iminopropanoate deaminase